MWHISDYQAGRITDLAVQIEKTGGEFYRKLAGKASNEKTKDLLLYLASEEELHQARFAELGRSLAPVNAPESYEGEYYDYLGFTVDSHLFNKTDKLEQLVENAQSSVDIIKLAMEFEKDTILFFNGFRNLVLKGHQSIIDDLIMEEQIHLVKLLRLRKEVQEDGQ